MARAASSGDAALEPALELRAPADTRSAALRETRKSLPEPGAAKNSF